MKINFQQKLILSFLLIFVLFTVGVVIFEQKSARRYKAEALEEKLDAYADMISHYLTLFGGREIPDSLLMLFPPNLRLTVIGRSGEVMFDNTIADFHTLENHADRPELIEALQTGKGTFIRESASVSQPYLYYAKYFGNNRVIRVALPYDLKVRHVLKPDNGFLYYIIALFLVGFLIIFFVGGRFGKSIRQLRDFSTVPDSEAELIPVPVFPKDELGEIGTRIVQDFHRIRESEKQLAREREKLMLHIQTSAEGICFFNADRKVAFYNGLFLQYFGILSNETIGVDRKIIEGGRFGSVPQFLDNRGTEDYYEERIARNGKEFLLRLNIFEDESFEIILTDITTREKTGRLKQEMTGNIAHELRTPVTSIRGFLEILLENEIAPDRAREYLERAYSQTKTLSGLISDMSLLTKIDERADSLESGDIQLGCVIEKVKSDLSTELQQKNILFTSEISPGLLVNGNENLIYSVFRNLTDNVISHAGTGVEIEVKSAGEKDGRIYISFSDNGKGIDEETHLNRLFERFYRVGEGRTRDTGGSGLGLSIVKNAIAFHQGSISVRKGEKGGLEFLFSLPLRIPEA